jgi:hypothetical protein
MLVITEESLDVKLSAEIDVGKEICANQQPETWQRRRTLRLWLIVLCADSLYKEEITVEPGYNDISFYAFSLIASDILCNQFFIINHNIILLSYNYTRL